MMLRSLSPAANSPSPKTKAAKKLSAMCSNISQQQQQQAPQELFQYHSVTFLYLKKEKQWKELGEGITKFSFDKDTSSIVIKRGEVVFHRVSLSTRVQSSVGTSQSWVFRAVHCTSGSHDVLCLQLPENAVKFVDQYEMHRESCLKELENAKSAPAVNKSLINRAISSSSTLSTDSANSENTDSNNNTNNASTTILNLGLDLSNGSRSISLKSTIPSKMQVSNTTSSAVTSPSSSSSVDQTTNAMRRRLSTYGNDFSIDGYAPGARHEDRMLKSPTQRSPLRPSVSGSAKTLRHAHALPTVVTFCGVSVKGIAPYNPDKQNQDALVLHQMPNGEILFSVFDGHGEEGRTVSQHFRSQIPRLLAESQQFNQDNGETTGEAIKDALAKAEKEIVDDIHVDTTLSGTTGVVAVVRGQKLFVANVGDSRAIFGMQDLHSESRAYVAKDITLDHKPDLPEEKKRIQEVGGRVFAVRFDDGIDGPARVWLSYAELPGLAMSRSLGDTIAKEAGVVSTPDMFEVDLTAEHRFLVMASDGLWEFMSSQEVVDIVAKYAAGPNPDPEGAIEELVEESARRWRMNEPVIDDTSIIVAFFV